MNARNPLGGRAAIADTTVVTEKQVAGILPTEEKSKINRGILGWRSLVDGITFGNTNLDNDPNYKKK